ncbi:hypothetical protein I4U23_022578 [Adineta vaga]|nr:hypothetical protein I4U23_022578 [Adineta vaga]
MTAHAIVSLSTETILHGGSLRDLHMDGPSFDASCPWHDNVASRIQNIPDEDPFSKDRNASYGALNLFDETHPHPHPQKLR